MNLVLDTLKSRRSFMVLGHLLGLIAAIGLIYFSGQGVPFNTIILITMVLLATEGLAWSLDRRARRLKALAPNAFPFKNLSEADRAFLQKSLLRLPTQAAGRAMLAWTVAAVVVSLAHPMGAWTGAVLTLGAPIAVLCVYFGNSAAGRRVAPFYYFEGDFADALSNFMPSLRRRQILWMVAPLIAFAPAAVFFRNELNVGVFLWLLFWATAVLLSGLRLFNDLIVSPIEDLGTALGRFGDGDYSALLDVTSGDALGVTTNRYNKTVRKTDRRFFVREHFGHMVVGDKSEQLFEGGLKLDGEEREVAVIACRLSGEKITLAAFNKFCTAVVECVEKHGGSIDQVSHGMVVALFNAPLKIENVEGEALEAAKEIKERLAVFTAQQKMQAGLSLQSGVGFAFGKAMLGLVGPKGRQRYTALGGVVEEARRLCTL